MLRRRSLRTRVRSRQRQLLPERGPVAVDDIRDALVIREGGTFLLTDPEGDVPLDNKRGFGLYHADTRHLSGYEFTLRNVDPVILTSTAELGFAQQQVLTNPMMVGQGGRNLERQTVEISRVRAISEDILEETLTVTNYNTFPITLDLLYRFEADFADIFEVRGYDREKRGKLLPTRVGESSVHLSYEGLDGQLRQTDLHFDPVPLELSEDHALHRISLDHLGTAVVGIEVHFNAREESPHTTLSHHFDTVASAYGDWFEGMAKVETDNQLFNEVLQRGLADIRILWARNPEGLEYPAAGTPWFDALFGRDSIVTALQMMALRPQIGGAVLQALASMQGDREEPERDEEPGKILHEYRRGDMAGSGELPFDPYYGSIDSTPLFLILAGEYFRWTGDVALMRKLADPIRRALSWMSVYGDPNGRGWLAYEKRSEKGLVNQGWKDSWDAIFHADGAFLQPPIALAEVQGYAYAALRAAAEILSALGDQEIAGDLTKAARRMARRFNSDFWLAGEEFYAVALDGEEQPAASITSNVGQALWTGIVSSGRAAAVANRLMSGEMYSGWGLRTLSNESIRFNPYGYHLGTVWPHDNSVVA
ncbi:MAG TPA: glycogen debranching N-terminal domain-containing protein, partial [Dehalococcoidia bacterium]|nr:glycogen debranching N-terminal domain-containing protein [Dehalococcoidia bacterium]